jgi:superfamily I DNA and/or RNA helicase
VIFLNTDLADCQEVRSGDFIQNPAEAHIASALVRVLVEAGLDPLEIGVVAPYRAQLKLIEGELREFEGRVEINTVDKFQGKYASSC